MKINRPFNTLTYPEYGSVLSQHQKYTDFNTLGLFRSLIENEKLDLIQKTALRDLAVAAFGKTFEFLQLKDPATYFALTTLGQQLTVADQAQRWTDIRLNQQKILRDKKLRHRNFGTYSKHNCGYDTCPMKGVMLRQHIVRMLEDLPPAFCSDKNRDAAQTKSAARKQDRKHVRRIISRQLDNE